MSSSLQHSRGLTGSTCDLVGCDRVGLRRVLIKGHKEVDVLAIVRDRIAVQLELTCVERPVVGADDRIADHADVAEVLRDDLNKDVFLGLLTTCASQCAVADLVGKRGSEADQIVLLTGHMSLPPVPLTGLTE